MTNLQKCAAILFQNRPLKMYSHFQGGENLKRKTRAIYDNLLNAIRQVVEQKDSFCQKPGIHFSRNRSLPFKETIQFVLNLESQSLQTNLNHFFSFRKDTPTRSAFIQQRKKINHEAFRQLFRYFMDSFTAPKLFHGYRLLACDGSDVNLPRNPRDTVTSCSANPAAKSYNKIHINALFDIMNRIYVDYSIDTGFASYEAEALHAFSDKLSGSKTIFIADRGYGTHNTILHLQHNNACFVIRTKDITSNGMLSPYHLPDAEFDMDISRSITSKRSKALSDPDNYVYIDKRSRPQCSKEDDVQIRFRVIRFRLSDGSYESIITNLPRDSFSAKLIKEIYHLRWGIETSFRSLKYTIDMMHFHAKRFALILQEIHASFTLFNFCSLILQSNPYQKGKEVSSKYIPNFSLAVDSCRKFLQQNGNPEYLNLLHMNPSAIRPGRRFPRYLHNTKPAPSFNYRPS